MNISGRLTSMAVKGGSRENVSSDGWFDFNKKVFGRVTACSVLFYQFLCFDCCFSSPRYVGNLPRIFDYSPLDPTQDFNTQM
jgi:hypothetical protein